MAQKRLPLWGFQLPALLFLLAAIVPVLKGGRLNLTYVVLAAAFAILSVVVAARNRGKGSTPPDA
jgi:hypothetical protein